MPTDVKDLRTLARRLLEANEVQLVIGYASGGDRGAAVPCFARTPDEAAALIFDRTCESNLTNYLRRHAASRVAIVVKGCDERSLIGLVQEKQVRRENVVVLGAPCEGVVDPRKTEAAVEPADGGAPAGGDVLYAGCRECAVRNPRFADHLIGPPVKPTGAPALHADVAKIEADSPAERWAAFRGEMGKCILCFACRNLCPACYCTTCFADSTQPKWMNRTSDPGDAMFFHLGRFLHLAGRCTGCGACVRGCPAGVDLRLYNDKVRKDVKEVFDFEAGMDPAAKPPLSCFRAEDPNDFVM